MPQFIDSSGEQRESYVRHWLENNLVEGVVSFRVQSAYFNSSVLDDFAGVIAGLHIAHFVLSRNVRQADLSALHECIAEVPDNSLTVVRFSDGLFHPKCYHIARPDGSETSVIGSANLTSMGIGVNAEACIVLDSLNGDAEDILAQIADAIDSWRALGADTGAYQIGGEDDIARLVELNILRAPRFRDEDDGQDQDEGAPRLPRVPRRRHWRGRRHHRPRRGGMPLVELPEHEELIEHPPPVSVPRAGFPPYLLFDVAATQPTSGDHAVTGAALPGDADGLIIRLNRDSARHFNDRLGTANISIPVATLSTIRFGVFGRGRYPDRPRAEFDLFLRYVGDAETIVLPNPVVTNIMAYGFLPAESGHGDVRMVVPAAVTRLATEVTGHGLPQPSEGDPAILEWPRIGDPAFRLTFLERDSGVYTEAQDAYNAASHAGQLVGDGACWLPDDLSPNW